jgi:ferredoxin
MTSEESNEYSRLCCQIVVDSSVDGLVLTVPASQE